MELYHGSPQIVQNPEIRITKFNKDFFFGFYCTAWDLARFKNPSHQICFNTPEALLTLRFNKAIEVYEEK